MSKKKQKNAQLRSYKRELTKYWLKSDINSATLDNSFQSPIEVEAQTLIEAKRLMRPTLFDQNFCVYDFKPANPGYLLLQRLDFMTKRQKFRERYDEIKINQNGYMNQNQQWLTNYGIEKRNMERQLKLKYPALFEDFQIEQKHHTDIFNTQPGYFPPLLGTNKQAETVQEYENDEEEWDDLQRFKDNKAEISLNQFRLYKEFISYEPHCHLIKNLIEYEIEYKKRMLWTQKDIETFLKAILENPPDFWTIGKIMPHKTTKELIFFYQSFKKLFNLKKHYQTCKVSANLPSQAVRKQTIQDIINDCVKPLIRYQNEKKNSSSLYGINQGVANAFTGQNQIYYSINELMQIYQSNSEPRRKFKENEKEKEKQINQALCNYHFNTFKQPKYTNQNIDDLEPIPYFEDVERRGNRLLDFCQNQLINQQPDQSYQEQSLTAKISFYVNLMQSSRQQMPQRLIKESLQVKGQEEDILRKRKFKEYFQRSTDRDLKKLVFVKYQYEDQYSNGHLGNYSHKRIKTEKYIEQLNQKNQQRITDLLSKKQSDQKIPVQSIQPQFQIQPMQLNKSASQISKEQKVIFQSAQIKEAENQQNVNQNQKIQGNQNSTLKQEQIKIIDQDFKDVKSKKNSLNVQDSSVSEDSQDMDDSQGYGGKDGSRARKGMLQWQDDEKEKFILMLQKHGRDWIAISKELPRKSDKQCRNYFQNYKHKLNLQQYLPNESKFR